LHRRHGADQAIDPAHRAAHEPPLDLEYAARLLIGELDTEAAA
jgi:hypothetical protein